MRWTATNRADKTCNSSHSLGTVCKVFPEGVGEQSHCDEADMAAPSQLSLQFCEIVFVTSCVYFGLLCFLQAVCWTLLPSARSPSLKERLSWGVPYCESAQWIDVCLGLLDGVWNLSIDSLCKEWHCGVCWVVFARLIPALPAAGTGHSACVAPVHK